MRALEDSTVTWTFTGSPSQTTTGLVSGYPPSGTDCTFIFHKGLITGRGDAGGENLIEGFSSLACSGGGMGVFDFVFSKLGDFRDWSMGSHTIVATKQNFGVDFSGSSGTGCNVASFDGMVLTFTVETATGGSAPYPQLVTDDFVRTFRLDFDTSSVMPTDNRGGPCSFPVTAQVALHLTQTASDYIYDPKAMCICE